LRLLKGDSVVAEPVEEARSLLARGLGLMGRAGLAQGQGLLIHRCNGIHMMFMRFAIDAVFLDKAGRVVRTYERLRPWLGIVPFVYRADKVAELPAGTVARLGICRGDRLTVAA
jgi:uncharacterized protein